MNMVNAAPPVMPAYAVSQLFLSSKGGLTAPTAQPSLLGVLGSFDVDGDGASPAAESVRSMPLLVQRVGG